MERPQERYARHLYRELASSISADCPGTELNLSGLGVNWKCVISDAKRACVVHCFENLGPEYLTIFEREGVEVATARTGSSERAVEAIRHWLTGEELSSLYDRFTFVDRKKRDLTHINESVLKSAPGLQNHSELQYLGSGLCQLWFRNKDRSALIYFYGKDDHASVICHWDACSLFSFRANDLSELGGVLKRWLCDNAMPSALRDEFSWLDIGELADYYERGKPIEGEFIDSWNRIEKFYDNEHFVPRVRVLQLICQLRQAEYDRTLRAGQSMYTLVLSRSRRHGLRIDQASIAFQFSWDVDAMKVIFRSGGEENAITTSVSLTDDIHALLMRLTRMPVD